MAYEDPSGTIHRIDFDHGAQAGNIIPCLPSRNLGH
jgi:hypothetical protein